MPFNQVELTNRDAQPIAGSGGVAVGVSRREPYAVLDDLMCVIEVFCVAWPSRGPFRSSGVFLL